MGCIALVRCVLVSRCGLAVVVWYPYAGFMPSNIKVFKRLFCTAFLEINFSPPIDLYGVNKSSDSEELQKLLKKMILENGGQIYSRYLIVELLDFLVSGMLASFLKIASSTPGSRTRTAAEVAKVRLL